MAKDKRTPKETEKVFNEMIKGFVSGKPKDKTKQKPKK